MCSQPAAPCGPRLNFAALPATRSAFLQRSSTCGSPGRRLSGISTNCVTSSTMSETPCGLSAALPPRLIVMALEVEGRGVFERQGVQVLYTGLGKVNAAIALTRRLAAYRHAGRTAPQGINFGTAGSRRFFTGPLGGR